MKLRSLFLLFFVFQIVNLYGVDVYWETTVRNVYNDLINAIGQSSKIAPELIFSDKERCVAAFSPSKHSITFERKAFDVCTSFGEDSLNAIAFILGHELGHFYMDHIWLKDAGSAYADKELGEKFKDAKIHMDTIAVYETQADEFSAFYTQAAG